MIPPKPAAPPPRPGGNLAPASNNPPQQSQSASTIASPSGQVEANFASGSLNMQIQKPRNPPPLPPGGLCSSLTCFILFILFTHLCTHSGGEVRKASITGPILGIYSFILVIWLFIYSFTHYQGARFVKPRLLDL